MTGETHLQILLRDMSPATLPEQYVFCTLRDEQITDFLALSPIAYFREQEGVSLVLTRRQAESANLSFDGSFGGITLNVHSSLHAVGLVAAISNALADNGISANVIAAYHHDHVFVPYAQLNRALEILKRVSANAKYTHT